MQSDVVEDFEAGRQVVPQAFEDFEFTILAAIHAKRREEAKRNGGHDIGQGDVW
jgi:hypothetical protein